MVPDIPIEDLDNLPIQTSYRALILTAIPVEYEALCKFLPEELETKNYKGSIYQIGKILLNNTNWEICIGKTGAHNPASATETERAIGFFKPDIALFVGIAGGIKDVKIGDIVVSEKIYPYEYGKRDGHFKSRPDSRNPKFNLIRVAEIISREKDWIKDYIIEQESKDQKVFIGAIVSGEKVINDRTDSEFKQIEDYFSDALALEMDGFGFLDAAYKNDQDALVIRGISDLCEGKGGAKEPNLQKKVAVIACAYAFEYLKNYQKYILENSSVKEYDNINSKNTFSEKTNKKDIIKIQDSIKSESLQQNSFSSNLDDFSQNPDDSQELLEIKKFVDNYDPEQALDKIELFKIEKWDSASDVIKNRIIANQGLAEIQLGNYNIGGNLLIKALEYNPNDLKALEIASMGYLFTDDYDNAIECTDKIIEKDPANIKAYSIQIQAESHIKSIEDIIPSIPKEILDSQEIAGAIGQCFFNNKNYLESEKWFEKAINNAEGDALLFRANYASMLYNKVKNDENFNYKISLKKEFHQNLEKSKLLFDEVINVISKNPSMIKGHIGWLIERGLAKWLLGLSEESSKDFIWAYEIDPENPITIFQKASIEFENGNYLEAEKLSEKILWNENTPGSLFIYLNSLKIQEKYRYGIEKIQEFKGRELTKDQINCINHFIQLFFIDLGEYEKAESILLTNYESDKKNIPNIIDLINFYQITGNSDRIETTIQEIKSIDLKSLSRDEQIEIGNIFYSTKHYSESSKIYCKFANPSENSPLTQKTISSLYLIENRKKALEYCKILHSNHGPQPYSSQIELSIYMEVGDLPEAERICHKYLEHYPDDYEMKLNLARVFFRANKISKVDSFLKNPYNFENLSPESGLNLVNLFYSTENYDEAIKLSFKLRNKFIDNPDIHLSYIHIILEISDRSVLLKHPDKVGIDDVVILENQLQKSKAYILSDNPDEPDKIAIPLSIKSELGSKIMNKSKGDKINFEAPVGEKYVIIKNILTKYVFAFQESVNNFSQQFIGHPGIFQIPFGTGKEGSLSDKDIENIKELVKKNQTGIEKSLELYKKKQFPISGIAKHFNKDIFTICSIFSKVSELGIFCCYTCSEQETENAKNNLISANRLIVDAVALYTISKTKIGDLIVKKYGKFGVSQSTVDLIRLNIVNLSGISSQGYLTIGLAGESLIGSEITKEEVQATKKDYEQFLEWLEQNCDILPCYESLSIDNNKKREYESLFGRAALETILLASSGNNILYSDDGLIQGIAKQLYNVKYVWSQIIFDDLKSDISSESRILEDSFIDILKLHQYPPKINSELLLLAAEEAKWQIESPFIELLEILENKNFNDPFIIRISAEFIIGLWLKRIDINDCNYLLFRLLKAITKFRDRTIICSAFVIAIKYNKELYDFEKDEIINQVSFFYDYLL